MSQICVDEALSREWLRQLLFSTMEGIYMLDRNGRCTYCSPEGLRLLGYRDTGELLGKDMHALAHHTKADGQPYPAGDCSICRPRHEDSQAYLENEVLWRADGSRLGAECRYYPISTVGGFVGAVVAFSDISERQRANERFRVVVESSPSAHVMVDPAGKIVLVNTNTEELFGYRREELLGQSVEVLVPEHLREAHREYRTDFLRTPSTRPMGAGRDLVARRKDGSHVSVEIGLNPVETAEGPFVIAASADITERQRVERDLFEAKERAQVTLHCIGDAVITTDTQGIVDYLNPVAEALTGWSIDAARGQPLTAVFQIVEEQSRKPAVDPMAQCLRTGTKTQLAQHTVLMALSGQEHAIEDSAAPIYGREGELLGVVLVFRDVTEARRMTREIAHQATHDPLTGLVNRREFQRRLDHALASAKEYGLQHALCYLDLDQFKLVNDTAGHTAGDKLLTELAHLLSRRIRVRDTLARLGGDEFSVLLENCRLDKAFAIAETLVQAVRDFRFRWEHRVFDIGVSVGLVPITGEAESATQLLSHADVACYIAKDLGRNRIHVHESGAPGERYAEILRAVDLKDALEKERFRLYCQPIVSLAPDSDLSPHYEVLVRLVEPQGHTVLPAAFIPAAERYGVMAAIDRWVIQTALRVCPKVIGSPQNAGLTLNLSGTSLNDDSLLAVVHQALTHSALPPERLCFEITETAAIRNLSRATWLINALKTSGCRFALDDFGSGLSSFTYLKNLPVDYLKIDGNFVHKMIENPVDRAIVETINQLGHRMGMRTIAEWVESEALKRELSELGVDYAQGNGMGSPRPLEEYMGG